MKNLQSGNFSISTAAFCFQAITIFTIAFNIPFFRPLFGFLYLTLLPGFLVTIILIDRESLSKLLLYSIGISLTIVMIGVAIINRLLSEVGIVSPISTFPILIFVVGCVTLLCVHIRIHNDILLSEIIDFPRTTFKIRLLSFLALLPILGILGANLRNAFNIVTVNIIFICLIATIPIFVGIFASKERTVILLILAASLSLLLNVNLTSTYIWGWDVHRELFVSNQVLTNHFWNWQWENNINTMLIYSILTPVYSIILNVKLILVFKLFYPILFSTVPLGIYLLSKNFFKKEIASFAPFIFIFYYGFFKNMPHKQYLAEIFLLSMLVLLFSDRKVLRNKVVLVAILGVGLVISHYATAFFSLILFAVLPITRLIKREDQSLLIFSVLSLFFFSFFIYWYSTIGGGIILQEILQRSSSTISLLTEYLHSPPRRSGANYVARGRSNAMWIFYKGLNVVLLGSIGIGLFTDLWHRLNIKYKNWNNNETIRLFRGDEYIAIASIVFCLLSSSVVITYGMGFDRILQYSLVFLSPYSILGFRNLHYILKELLLNRNGPDISWQVITIIFLMCYFLFSSGVGFIILGGAPPPYSITVDTEPEWHVYSPEEVAGVEWLNYQRGCRKVAALDKWNKFTTKDILLLEGYCAQENILSINPSQDYINTTAYLYIGEGDISEWWPTTLENSSISTTTEQSGKIYDSGKAEVYRIHNETKINQSDGS